MRQNIGETPERHTARFYHDGHPEQYGHDHWACTDWPPTLFSVAIPTLCWSASERSKHSNRHHGAFRDEFDSAHIEPGGHGCRIDNPHVRRGACDTCRGTFTLSLRNSGHRSNLRERNCACAKPHRGSAALRGNIPEISARDANVDAVSRFFPGGRRLLFAAGPGNLAELWLSSLWVRLLAGDGSKQYGRYPDSAPANSTNHFGELYDVRRDDSHRSTSK